MIITRFNHEIDDGGLAETATLEFGSRLGPGIGIDRLPTTLVAAMSAHLGGGSPEPVEWVIQEVYWDMIFGRGGMGDLSITLRRVPPTIVGPQDGGPWWPMYEARIRNVQQAVEAFRPILNP